jgi:hypothetical protein
MTQLTTSQKTLAQAVDGELLELSYQVASLTTKIEVLRKRVRYREEVQQDLENSCKIKMLAQRQIRLLEDVAGNYGWTRAWIVPGGHVHRDYHCHTLYPTTERYLVPQVSGLTEDEIVAKAGERACTACYPTAPSEYLARKSELFTKDEAAKEAARAEREAKRAAKEAAKVVVITPKINSRTQEPYESRETFGTLRSAQNEIIGKLWWAHRAAHHEQPGHALEYYNECKPIATAMAAHSQETRTAEEIMKECDTKAEKNFQRDLRKSR